MTNNRGLHTSATKLQQSNVAWLSAAIEELKKATVDALAIPDYTGSIKIDLALKRGRVVGFECGRVARHN